MVAVSDDYLEMLAEDSCETLVKRLNAHKDSIEAVEKYVTAIQAEINKREAVKREQEKAQADRKRQQAHKDSIWQSLKSYGDKYGWTTLAYDFGLSVDGQCYPDTNPYTYYDVYKYEDFMRSMRGETCIKGHTNDSKWQRPF
jgi:hypothetical protein